VRQRRDNFGARARRRADAASTIGGGESTLTPPDAPAEFSAPAAPSALGGFVPPPLLWSVIQTIIPDVWPDGDRSASRAIASARQGFASAINGIVDHLAGPSGVVGSQQIPEGGKMTAATSELTKSLSDIASEAGKLATQTTEFADDVENTQNAIRDLMDRVSPSDLWDGITSVFTSDALEEIKQVADDIKPSWATTGVKPRGGATFFKSRWEWSTTPLSPWRNGRGGSSPSIRATSTTGHHRGHKNETRNETRLARTYQRNSLWLDLHA
jgi:hypothetical protein